MKAARNTETHPVPKLSLATALRRHWPEFLIEAGALGLFMVSAGVFTALLEWPGSWLRQNLASEGLRRSLIGRKR